MIFEQSNEKDSIPGYAHLKEDELTIEGCFRFSEAILKLTYEDYVSSLKTIKRINSKGRQSKKDRRDLLAAYKMKYECEDYYLSPLYQLNTLGKGLPGEDVIKEIQRRVNFNE